MRTLKVQSFQKVRKFQDAFRRRQHVPMSVQNDAGSLPVNVIQRVQVQLFRVRILSVEGFQRLQAGHQQLQHEHRIFRILQLYLVEQKIIRVQSP